MIACSFPWPKSAVVIVKLTRLESLPGPFLFNLFSLFIGMIEHSDIYREIAKKGFARGFIPQERF